MPVRRNIDTGRYYGVARRHWRDVLSEDDLRFMRDTYEAIEAQEKRGRGLALSEATSKRWRELWRELMRDGWTELYLDEAGEVRFKSLIPFYREEE